VILQLESNITFELCLIGTVLLLLHRRHCYCYLHIQILLTLMLTSPLLLHTSLVTAAQRAEVQQCKVVAQRQGEVPARATRGCKSATRL
jgi:multisubunit Na+/H+ antiporter MnhG subunit